MTDYSADRKFTDLVHAEIAMKEIYPRLGWTECSSSRELQNLLDMQLCIDYTMQDQYGQHYNVQERFRDCKYRGFNDFTLRYRRDHNPNISRHASEFYKIKADFMVYGIINGAKAQVLNHEPGISFAKYAVINLKVLYRCIANGQIILNSEVHRSRLIGSKLHAAINQNADKSSNFISFDIPSLAAMFGEDLILTQKGYF